MNKILLAALIGCFLFASCKTSKKATPSMPNTAALTGTWELNYITGPRIAFDGLYPNKKPMLKFDASAKTVGGNTSCNSFNGQLKVDGNKISFNDPMAMTRMMCPGDGENTFLETLKKVNSWSVSDGKILNLITGDIAVMRFTKK